MGVVPPTLIYINSMLKEVYTLQTRSSIRRATKISLFFQGFLGFSLLDPDALGTSNAVATLEEKYGLPANAQGVDLMKHAVQRRTLTM